MKSLAPISSFAVISSGAFSYVLIISVVSFWMIQMNFPSSERVVEMKIESCGRCRPGTLFGVYQEHYKSVSVFRVLKRRIAGIAALMSSY